MSTTISFEEVQQGDKLRVTHTLQDAESTYVGVAHYKANNHIKDWRTKGGVWLCMDENNAVIELLERPKSPEEILAERRDKIVQELASAMGRSLSDDYSYAYSTDLTKAAVNRIIKLEDEAKESL